MNEKNSKHKATLPNNSLKRTLVLGDNVADRRPLAVGNVITKSAQAPNTSAA